MEQLHNQVPTNDQEVEESKETTETQMDAGYEQRTLNTDQAARYLNVDKSAIYLARSQGQIPADKQGRNIYFSRADLDAFKKLLEEQAATASLEPVTIPEGTFSTDEAAQYLGINKSALYQARSMNRLAARKQGRLAYYTQEDLDAFKENEARRQTEQVQYKSAPQEYSLIQQMVGFLFEQSPPQSSILKIEEAQRVRAWNVQVQTVTGATRKTIVHDGNRFYLLDTDFSK